MYIIPVSDCPIQREMERRLWQWTICCQPLRVDPPISDRFQPKQSWPQRNLEIYWTFQFYSKYQMSTINLPMKMTAMAVRRSFSGRVRWFQQAIHPELQLPGTVVISESVVSMSTDLLDVISVWNCCSILLASQSDNNWSVQLLPVVLCMCVYWKTLERKTGDYWGHRGITDFLVFCFPILVTRLESERMIYQRLKNPQLLLFTNFGTNTLTKVPRQGPRNVDCFALGNNNKWARIYYTVKSTYLRLYKLLLKTGNKVNITGG